MKEGHVSSVVAGVMGLRVGRGVERSSSSWEDQVVWESLRWRISVRAVQAARAGVAPAGAKGLLVVSMYQIASARRRAMSTRATLAPRCLPRRCLVCW